MYEQLIVEGMILCSRWGHNGRDRDFFEVLRRSETHVLIREIDSAPAGADDTAPLPGVYIGASMRRKVRHYHGREYILVDGINEGDRAEIHERSGFRVCREDASEREDALPALQLITA